MRGKRQTNNDRSPLIFKALDLQSPFMGLDHPLVVEKKGQANGV